MFVSTSFTNPGENPDNLTVPFTKFHEIFFFQKQALCGVEWYMRTMISYIRPEHLIWAKVPLRSKFQDLRVAKIQILQLRPDSI